MKRTKVLALLLVLAMLLTGCNLSEWKDKIADALGDINAQTATPFSQMEYVRPDIEKMEAAVDECCALAQTAKSAKVLLEKVRDVFAQYDTFSTQYSLAYIYYCMDMSNGQWQEEYGFCLQNTGRVEALLEEMLCALAESPLKKELEKEPDFGEGFFDGYEGDALWDETFLSLMEQEAALEEEYYDLCAQAQESTSDFDEYFEKYGEEMGQLLVDLVALRQEIAEYAGYEDYASFCYDFDFYRDYTPRQAETYLEEIRKELVPLYRQVESAGGPSGAGKVCKDTQALAYVKKCAQNMGGTVYNAFKLMQEASLYDIAYDENKYDGSFEIYLVDYSVPYVFVNPSATQWDKLTFTHEFGHFCQDYASFGGVGSVDVAEVFSQGLEYLALCYGGDADNLEEIKMVDGLRIYVDQAAYAMFEYKLYQLEGDELTVENVFELYEEVGLSYGFDSWGWDCRDLVTIGHFYTDPMYIISYVVSNDAALQLYQMEREEKGAGLALYEKQLTSQQGGFLAFVEEAGLKSPFAKGRLKEVRETLEAVLG